MLNKLSYLRSLLITAPLIFLYTAIMGSISVASSLVDPSGRIQHACSRIWAKMILWTSRVQVQISGAEHVKVGRPYVLCANHQSHMDIPILLAGLPFQFRFAAKRELFRYPFLGWHLRRSGHLSINRENPHAAVKSLQDAVAGIERGTPVLIFPEGGTSRDGTIKPFKGGGFMLAGRSNAELVPVTIRGSRTILRPKTYHVRKGTVEIIIGEPISSANVPISELANRVRHEVLATFNYEQTLDRNSYSLSREL
jgi:1-acyl-sn-glycerol-3-phosphate acyltransferase